MSNVSIPVTRGRLESNFDGFLALTELNAALNTHAFENIDIDFSHCTWFDANMCAPLGAVLAKAADELNTVNLVGLTQSIRTILAKNQFLTNFGYRAEADSYGTTIKYKRFGNSDDQLFAEYLNQLKHGKGLPDMSEALSKRFNRSLLEVFVNASMHAASKLGVFACGQFYPKQHRLDFSISDAGIGIRRKIAKELGLKLNSDQAIAWALAEGHTTRQGSVPGGLGLKLIREFITLNKGRIQIVSDRGYWEMTPAGETCTRFENGFPGTVINIEIDTTDQSSYRLSSEA